MREVVVIVVIVVLVVIMLARWMGLVHVVVCVKNSEL